MDCHIEFLNCVYQNFWGCPECWSRNTIVTKEARILDMEELRRKTVKWYSKMVDAGKIEPVPVHATKVHESDLLSEIDGKKGKCEMNVIFRCDSCKRVFREDSETLSIKCPGCGSTRTAPIDYSIGEAGQPVESMACEPWECSHCGAKWLAGEKLDPGRCPVCFPYGSIIEYEPTFSPDEEAVLNYVADGLREGRKVYGKLDVANDSRDFLEEARQEIRDTIVYLSGKLLEIEALQRKLEENGLVL